MDLTCDEEMLDSSPSPAPGPCKKPKTSEHPIDPIPFNLNFNIKPRPAIPQETMLDDPRTLQQMLTAEDYYLPNPNYFKVVQGALTPEMRAEVSTWMYEVCEEEHCAETVFLRAILYMDRFLSVHKIELNQLQLLGAVCLLLSSKWSGTIIGSQRLCAYTAGAINLEMLLEWEHLVLAQLKWDIYAITPSEFVDYILYRMPEDLKSNSSPTYPLRALIELFTAYCATEQCYLVHPPSIIACACIATAIGGNSHELTDKVLNCLHEITHIDTDLLKNCVEPLKVKINQLVLNSLIPGKKPGLLKKIFVEPVQSPKTPTDVQEVHF